MPQSITFQSISNKTGKKVKIVREWHFYTSRNSEYKFRKLHYHICMSLQGIAPITHKILKQTYLGRIKHRLFSSK
jgi:hypothetical protein